MPNPFAHLLEDDPARQVFRILPEAFVDPAVFELEMTRIFESTWIFVTL